MQYVEAIRAICVAQGVGSLKKLAELTKMRPETLERLVGNNTSDVFALSWRSSDLMLRSIGVAEAERRALRQQWRSLQESVHGVRRPLLYTAAVPTRDSEIAASTPGEFIELLQLLQVRSGQPASRLAERAAIPRSQAYALIKQGRTVLPTQLDQVKAFARACGLQPDKVELVAALWTRLRESAVTGVPVADLMSGRPDVDMARMGADIASAPDTGSWSLGLVAYALRTKNGVWHGEPDLLPLGKYGEYRFGRRRIVRCAELPIDECVSQTTVQVRAIDGRKFLVPITKVVRDNAYEGILTDFIPPKMLF